jgi:predicted DsbA family dithiol-disulfide isomerase
MQACRPLEPGEILNASHSEWPLIKVVIYGDPTLCAKLAKRLVCAVKHLPLRLRMDTITDTQVAIEAGVGCDPTLFINGKPFIEGMVAAETLTAAFESLLKESL